MKIGLYFGTFNPIHMGHLIIANHMTEFTDLDEMWLVVTPHNPMKKKASLLDDRHRLELVHRAVEEYEKIKVSDIEFSLSQPSYTTNTLAALREKFPQHDFSLIMGGDNLNSFHKWRNYEDILENHHIYVYPRLASVPGDMDNHPKIHYVAAPIMQISSSFIRKAVRDGKDIRALIPYKAWKYLDEMNFYKQQ